MRLGDFLKALGQLFLNLADGTSKNHESISSVQDSVTKELLLAEYRDLYQNIMHLENKLFNHLSFFTTLFMGIVTASIAIIQLTRDSSSPLAQPVAVASSAVLFLLFVIVGRFELRMTTELRVRKIKFVEGIALIRQYFLDRDDSIRGYLALPIGLKEAPPYLRVRCKDWYQVLYISLMNGIAAATAWILPLWFVLVYLLHTSRKPIDLILRVAIIICWLAIGILIFHLFFWKLSYKSVMEFCARYDAMREEKVGSSEYKLLDPPLPKSWHERTFGDWVARWTERRLKRVK